MNIAMVIGHDVIFERGKKCFRAGETVGVSRSGSRWSAISIGTEIYKTVVSFSDGEAREFSCSCPYAYGGSCRCKHEASLMLSINEIAPGVFEDDDEKLIKALQTMSLAEIEDALQLAIDLQSLRCTAVLLNHRGDREFSIDEFTLDDLPEELGLDGSRAAQGDNSPLKLLFGNDSRAEEEFMCICRGEQVK